MKKIISIIVIVGGIMANTASATNRHVVAAGTIDHGLDVYPYNTWTNAATNIQLAVDAATNTETVWVSNGTYVLTSQILITNAITLQGTNGRDFTFIDGGFTGEKQLGETTNKRCLLMSNAGAFVSGFTISNGAFVPTVTKTGGGGVLMYGGILSNCWVKINKIFSPSNSALANMGGGGIYIYSAGTVTASRVSANIITNVIGGCLGHGGGIAVYGSSAAYPMISDCVVSNNEVSGGDTFTLYGGGMYLDYCNVRLCTITENLCGIKSGGGISGTGGGFRLNYGTADGCTITLNRSGYGGGVTINAGTITNCVIARNYTGQYAGGLHSPSGDKTYTLNSFIMNNTSSVGPTIDFSGSGESKAQECLIVSNVSLGGNSGSDKMIFRMRGSTNDALINSTISANNGVAVQMIGKGGIIRNCLVAGNSNNGTITRGAGLLIQSGTNISVSGCTIVGNIDTNLSTVGAGIRFVTTFPSTPVSVSSCVIYSNGVGGADDVYDACTPTNINALQYSCVGTNTGPFTGAGIIVTDPKFKDFVGGNYRLAANSPCINTGSNATWMNTAVDRDGRTRIRYGTVDMGAYERINEGTIYGVR